MRKHLKLAVENEETTSTEGAEQTQETPASTEKPETAETAAEVDAFADPQPAGEVPAEVEGEVAELQPTEAEAQVEAEDAEEAQAFDESETVSVVLESLACYAAELQHLIDTKACTPATYAIVQMGIQHQLNRLGASLPAVSLESADGDITRQHELALEGVKDFLRNTALDYAQWWVVSQKKNNDAWGQLFSRNTTLVSKYAGRLERGLAEYENKKGEWQDAKHHASLAGVREFFMNHRGSVHDFVKALGEDSTFSAFVLGEYTKKVLDLLTSLAAIVKSGSVADEKSALALAKKVEALPHPALELFPDKYVDKAKWLLGKIGTEVKHGSERSVVTIGGVRLERLAKLAAPAQVVESKSFWHEWIDNGNDAGSALAGMMSTSIPYVTEDIALVFKAGLAYTKACEAYVKYKDELSKAQAAMGEAIDHLAGTGQDGAVKDVAHMLRQLQQYAENIVRCYSSPGKSEYVRAIRAARYTDYIGKRMIFNAK